MNKLKIDPLISDLERALRAILTHKNKPGDEANNVSTAERLRAMEIGAKIAMAKHKVLGGSTDDEPFCGTPNR